jgi:hypothetical protein
VAARRRLPRRREPTTAERGYGSKHRRLRTQVAKVVAAGRASCWRCGQPIHPGAHWDLGHSDSIGAKTFGVYKGPEHRTCSRSAGGWKRWGYAVPPLTASRLTGPTPRALKFFETANHIVSQRITDSEDE